MTVQELDLTIKHRAGRKNVRADALSRNPADVVTETSINAVTAKESCDKSVSKSIPLSEKEQQCLEEIHQLQWGDSELMVVFHYLEDGILPHNDTYA